MTLLVVDDRDGRVVAELESQKEALRLLETLDNEARDTDSYCIVIFNDQRGAIVGSETSVTIRPLIR